MRDLTLSLGACWGGGEPLPIEADVTAVTVGLDPDPRPSVCGPLNWWEEDFATSSVSGFWLTGFCTADLAGSPERFLNIIHLWGRSARCLGDLLVCASGPRGFFSHEANSISR